MSSAVNRRINNELKNIIEKFHNVNCKKLFPNNEYKITISFKNRNITFFLDKNYPFKEPIVKINGNDYIKMLCISTDNFSKKILNTKYNIDCLCCTSLSCPNVWKPAKSILDYMLEIETNINIIETILAMKYTYIVCKSKNIFCNEIPEYICKFI